MKYTVLHKDVGPAKYMEAVRRWFWSYLPKGPTHKAQHSALCLCFRMGPEGHKRMNLRGCLLELDLAQAALLRQHSS